MIIELKKICFIRFKEQILRNLTLSINEGETIIIRGRSGVGKTTLAKIAALLIKPSSGKVFFRGKDVTIINEYRRSILRLKYIGYIDQYFKLIPTLTIIDNVSLPLRLIGVKKQEAYIKATKLLKELNIHNVKDRYPHEVSGGQRQRAAIARALIKKPLLIVADEPFSNLDDQTTSKILSILRNYAKNNKAGILITTTDLYTKYVCNHDYLLRGGVLIKKP